MKKFLSILISSIMLLSSTAFAAPNTRYVLNNKEVSINADAVVQNGTIYLPAIDTFKACGYYVKSTNNSITAMATGRPGYVSIWVNKKTAILNGKKITLGTAPFFKNGACYVSSKFIEEQTGVKVSYVPSKKTIYLDFKNAPRITSTVSSKKININEYLGTYVIYTGTDIDEYRGANEKQYARAIEIRKELDGTYSALIDTSRSHKMASRISYMGNGIFGNGESFDRLDENNDNPEWVDKIAVTLKDGEVYITWTYTITKKPSGGKETKKTVTKTFTAKKTNNNIFKSWE